MRMSCSTTSQAPQSGPRIAIASVTRPSSLASRPLRSDSIRPRGCGMWVNGVAPSLRRRLGGAVREHSADAAVDQAVDRTLGQLDRGDVVAPVDERRHAGIDLRQRADQVAEIIVLGLVVRRQIEMHVPQVVGGHPFRADAAQRRLPGVHMRVHQARHHDLVGGVDHLVGRRIEISPDGFDPIAAKQKLPTLEVADCGIEGDQPAAFDQHALHRLPSKFASRVGCVTVASPLPTRLRHSRNALVCRVMAGPCSQLMPHRPVARRAAAATA